MPETDRRRIELYDTTLRDGTQGADVSFTVVDKLKIAELLDDLGVDFIEGGYPLSNPKDVAFFEQVAQKPLKHARVCAFGMTRRKAIDPADDPGMQALVKAGTSIIAVVGKTWDLHVDEVLRVSREENLAMIRDSVGFCARSSSVDQVFYDAEHFFDGYRANPQYALQTLQAAIDGGASRLVLCDTNGGSMPAWISQVVGEVQDRLAVDRDIDPASLPSLAIHPHNDAGLGVACALAAVEAGCVQVQGTINGIGERCGNVDLTTVAANLQLKMGYDCLAEGALQKLTEVSRAVYERANLAIPSGQPYVGVGAFSHKGGMHVHAVQRFAHSYEHVTPESVGNQRRILVSELSGASNIAATLGQKFDIAQNKDLQRQVLAQVQELENHGYQYEAAGASFELLVYQALGKRPAFWELDHYRCAILKRNGDPSSTEATVKLSVNGTSEHRVAEGDGPVNALDAAMRKALKDHYPRVMDVHLSDYKVRVVNPTAESAAKVRVIAEFTAISHASGDQGNANAKAESADGEAGSDKTRHFSTIGVNENIVDASWEALAQAFQYHLIETSEKG